MTTAAAIARLDQLVATYTDVTIKGARRYLDAARAVRDGDVELIGDDTLDGFLAGALASAAQANAYRFALAVLVELGIEVSVEARAVLVELDRNASAYPAVEMRER